MQVLSDETLERLGLGLAFLLLWFLVGVGLVLFRRWSRRRWEDRVLRGPRPPCPHRFIRVRWRVEGERFVDPKPECADCGAEVPNVVVKEERKP